MMEGQGRSSTMAKMKVRDIRPILKRIVQAFRRHLLDESHRILLFCLLGVFG